MIEQQYGIDWSDFGYAANSRGDVGGHGTGTSEAELDALNKALRAGDGQAVPDQAVSGALQPLMPESLDGTLASLTYTEADHPLWQMIFKDRAYNTAEEYNQLLRVGEGEGGFIAEGDLPDEEDSTYKRRVTLIKFMGVTRRVTHVASLVRTAGVDSAIAAETRDGTTWLMRILEEALFFGDSSIIPEQFDGLKKLLTEGGAPTYDIRGGSLTVKVVNGLTAIVRKRPNYGRVDTMFSSVGVKSDVVNNFLDLLRGRFGEKATVGLTVDEIETQNGKVKLVDDIFIEEGQAPFPNGLGKVNKRPAKPMLTGALSAANDNAASKFAAGDTGDYIFAVVAVNRYGRSAPLYTAAVSLGAAGKDIRLPVQDGGNGTTGYIIYRSEKNGAQDTCKEAFRVARTGATQTITDLNAYLPGTSTVFGLEMQPNTIKWKQLAPFTKIPLATVDTSIRWMQVLYGAVQVKKPRHNFLIINVGRDPNSPVLAQEIGLDGF